jgi:hypothetical protein
MVTVPLAGWTTATVAGMALIARLEFYRDAKALRAGQKNHIQLALTSAQCREFGLLLLRMAEQLSQPPDTGRPQ